MERLPGSVGDAIGGAIDRAVATAGAALEATVRGLLDVVPGGPIGLLLLAVLVALAVWFLVRR